MHILPLGSTGGAEKGPDLWAQWGIKAPEVLFDVIDPPSQERLEKMIQAVEARFK